MNRKIIVMKIIIVLFVTFIAGLMFSYIDSCIKPIIENKAALNQMQNTMDSSLWIQTYSYISNCKILLWIAMVVIVFAKEIGNLISNLLGE